MDAAVLQKELSRGFRGTAHFGAGDRGRYTTDASIYQVMPAGVVLPRDDADLCRAIEACTRAEVPLTMRGGGTSQCGQTVNRGLIADMSKHMNAVLALDAQARRVLVQPGIVLDELNRQLRPHGLWFPVDVSTASRATIGGMTANNSCGARSLRYGTMRDNLLSISGYLASGASFSAGRDGADGLPEELLAGLLALGETEAEEIRTRFPKVQRRVGGYNLDALLPEAAPLDVAQLLAGSEGTLAVFSAIELKLSPLPPAHKRLGACHFPSFRAAMEAAQHIVPLGPTSVELVDLTLLELAREIPMFRPTLEAFVRGRPAAVLLVEFADTPAENARSMERLRDTMADMGLGFGEGGAAEGGVVDLADPAVIGAVGELRKAGLNIMMSMKEAGKPVSFVEDCAVPLRHLADYTDRLTAVFARHGTQGTWYAHASEGCLHVRPVLNLKLEEDVRKMRAIAEEAFAMVREYKGSHSGEHGDGIVRSEFHEQMFGPRLTAAFGRVKEGFDPEGLLNPGRIVEPPRMDDRSLMRYPPGYRFAELDTGFDWSAWTGASGGFQGAVEMCNNNGACRKLRGGAMCPSFRVTRDERDVTRGRANTLRLALTGQIGADALYGPDVEAALRLCVGCKACQRECPTGVDMARMKTEVLYQRARRAGVPLRERLIAELPRYARYHRVLRPLVGVRNALPPLAWLSEGLFGFARDRSLPGFAADPFRDGEIAAPDQRGATARAAGGEVVLFTDTFSRWMEPGIPRAALRVLRRAGYRIHAPVAGRAPPLCCGRTYLAAGMIDDARAQARRTLELLLPHVRAGRTILGLEPSCLLTLRDEFPALLPGEESRALAGAARLFEEFAAEEQAAGRFVPEVAPAAPQRRILLHGHCHQKAAGVMGAMEAALAALPSTEARTVETSCCGMAGAFGYRKETAGISRKMAEADLLPAVRAAAPETLLVANGTSCRHQIAEESGRRAWHLAELYDLVTGERSK